MYKVSILSIGDELCIGQTVNTNAAWMAQQLINTGAEIVTHSTIRDGKREISSEIDRLSKFSDLILVTGGLGPTHDDITKAVLVEYFNDELILNEKVLENLKEFYKKRKRKFLDRHKQQAMVPKSCIVLDNSVGTAPGMKFVKDSFTLVSMPGVPREMQALMQAHIIPSVKETMQKNNNKVQIYRTLKTVGIPESKLAENIGDLDFLGSSSLAFLPSYLGVKLRLGTVAESFEKGNKVLDKLEKHIRSKVEEFIVSNSEEELSKIVSDKLKEMNITIATAESCTGGMLGEYLTKEAGASNYLLGGLITYSNESKINLLDINENLIEKHGAVSEYTAKNMARNVRRKFASHVGLSITGISGPDGGSDEKPVGTVWIGYSDHNHSFAKRFIFSNDREVNRKLSVGQTLALLLSGLKKQK